MPDRDGATWYSLFMGVGTINVTHSVANCCGTSTDISYTAFSMGGMSAMIIRASNIDADQTGNLANAGRDGDDCLNAAITIGSRMGRMSANVGAAFRTAADDYVDSVTIAASAGIGGATVGCFWNDNDDNTDGAYRSGTTGWMDHWREVLARRLHAGNHLQQLGTRQLRRSGRGNRPGHQHELRCGCGLSAFAEYLAFKR